MLKGEIPYSPVLGKAVIAALDATAAAFGDYFPEGSADRRRARPRRRSGRTWPASRPRSASSTDAPPPSRPPGGTARRQGGLPGRDPPVLDAARPATRPTASRTVSACAGARLAPGSASSRGPPGLWFATAPRGSPPSRPPCPPATPPAARPGSGPAAAPPATPPRRRGRGAAEARRADAGLKPTSATSRCRTSRPTRRTGSGLDRRPTSPTPCCAGCRPTDRTTTRPSLRLLRADAARGRRRPLGLPAARCRRSSGEAPAHELVSFQPAAASASGSSLSLRRARG